MTRHGPLLHHPGARIHHAEAPGARFGLFRRRALGALNILLLHRVHAPDRAWSARETKAMLRRRALIELLKDLQALDWRVPRARGILFALRHVDEIMAAPDDEIDALFARFQAI